MSIITFILSALLVGFGGYALYSGFDIVTTERGLALTLCGTMALSIGIVVFALGFILVQLKRIAANLNVQTELETDDDGLSDVIPKVITPHITDFNYEARDVHAEKTQEAPLLSEPTSPLSKSEPPLSISSVSRFSPISSSYKSVGALAAGAGIIAAGTGFVTSSFATKEQDKHDEDDQINNPEMQNTNAPQNMIQDHDIIQDHAIQDHPIQDHANQDHANQDHANQDHAFVPETQIQEELSYVDLDKLIDELAVETSITAQNPPHGKTGISTPVVEPLSAFEAELRGDDLRQDLEQDLGLFEGEVAHVLPHDKKDDAIDSQTDEEPKIIGAYDSGGVTYTLYSDGGVVAQAGDISEEYSSLEALKAALEDGSSAFKA
jgi:hypothetical protein